mgnify:FL=1
MPPPTPTLALTRTSSSSFTAAVSGGSASATHSLQYRLVGATQDTSATPITGNGAFAPITDLVDHATYWAWSAGLESGSYSQPAWGWVSLASPQDLLGAFHTHWYGDPALVTAVPGGLWTGEVPEGTAYPYAWLELPNVTSHPNFVNQIESSNVVTHVWAQGVAAASG